jgi:hypothetical protein
MVMPASGTFAYVATVPDRRGNGDFECRAETREQSLRLAMGFAIFRLVGMTPVVRVTEAGLTPDAGPERPLVMRSRIALGALSPHRATVAEVSFHVDRELTACMAAGDEVHLTRSPSGGLACRSFATMTWLSPLGQ